PSALSGPRHPLPRIHVYAERLPNGAPVAGCASVTALSAGANSTRLAARVMLTRRLNENLRPERTADGNGIGASRGISEKLQGRQGHEYRGARWVFCRPDRGPRGRVAQRIPARGVWRRDVGHL